MNEQVEFVLTAETFAEISDFDQIHTKIIYREN